MKYLDLHGDRVAYRESGAGEALLLIHGMAGSSATWRAVLPQLSKRYRVVAPDAICLMTSFDLSSVARQCFPGSTAIRRHPCRGRIGESTLPRVCTQRCWNFMPTVIPCSPEP
jgi:pimeloyl-ACP methyl ester carboxylesterase